MTRIFSILIAVLFLSVGQTASAQDSELLKRAQNGDAEAQYNLGSAYARGEGVEQDDAEAVKWWRLAAEQGNVDAQGIFCLMGFFSDDEEARTEIVNRCESWEKQRHAESIEENKKYGLDGFNSYYSSGAGQSYAKSVRRYLLAAEQGDTDAQYALGDAYYYGRGIEQDYAKALYWYRLAAQQGDAFAQVQVGYAYHNGEGIEQDASKAMYWNLLAAEQGNIVAQINIGVLYRLGEEGVTQNLVYSYMWFDTAAIAGSERAVEARDRVAEEMTPEQISEAQELARECERKDFKDCGL